MKQLLSLAAMSIQNLVKKGVATVCAHCNGNGSTKNDCCKKAAGLDMGKTHIASSKCCSCDGLGYHKV